MNGIPDQNKCNKYFAITFPDKNFVKLILRNLLYERGGLAVYVLIKWSVLGVWTSQCWQVYSCEQWFCRIVYSTWIFISFNKQEENSSAGRYVADTGSPKWSLNAIKLLLSLSNYVSNIRLVINSPSFFLLRCPFNRVKQFLISLLII